MIDIELKELKKERSETIIKLYHKFLKECPRTNKRSVEYAVNKIIECEAPKYYISYGLARKVIGKMLKHNILNIQRDNKSAMYKEIYDKIITFINENPGKKYNEYLREILNKPASSFFLSKGRIISIIYGR